MEQKKTSWRAFETEAVLESRYDQLLHWGILLTRGDAGEAREIVHDLCLYLILTKTDFNRISNQDGYLYTSLRHVYLSRMTRASREALRFVSIGDFDNVHFALSGRDRSGSVLIQNDLRTICGYSVWRKEASKGFSYFILHFFHGYFPREIAEIACLPVSAIYNKLKSARTELKEHLSAPDKVRPIKQGSLPLPRQSPIVVPTPELFQELRETILQARRGACLPEEDLLAYYEIDAPVPIPCELLSHIVSCQRCLALIDRHFRRPTLKDRDALDGFDRVLNMQHLAQGGTDRKSVKVMFETMRREKERIYHHRPQSLFIAVNTRVVAFHDVQGIQSALSIRLEYSEQPNCVEVFSEQQIRLAMIAIDSLPPDGPERLTQQTLLSDTRRLELNLSFDGLGLQCEVVYSDPEASTGIQDAMEELRPSTLQALVGTDQPSWIKKLISTLVPSPAMAWGLALAFVACAGAYFMSYIHQPRLDASAVLNQAVAMEAAKMAGATRHQTMNLIETTSDGLVLRGIVETWQEGQTGRHIRRLYDLHHHVIASEWKDKNGRSGVSIAPSNTEIDAPARQLAMNDLWKQDLSSADFRALGGKSIRVSVVNGEYKLSATMEDDNKPRLLSAVLVLDSHLNAVGEELYLHKDSPIRELQLLQTGQDYQPSSNVPDSVFSNEEEGMGGSPVDKGDASMRDRSKPNTNTQLVQLEIGALYELNQMGADIGDPIDVVRAPDGRIRIYGTVADNARRSQLLARLETLPNQQLLTIQLNSQSSLRSAAPSAPKSTVPTTSVYSVTRTEAPSEVVLKQYFESKGWTGDREKSAVSQFSQEAREHAQRALQRAYALNRLGTSFTARELSAANPAYQRQWARMASAHAFALEIELSALNDQLSRIIPDDHESLPAHGGEYANIDDPATLARATERLLHKTQELSRIIGGAFASGVVKSADRNGEPLLTHARNSIPLREAAAIVSFTQRLSHLDAHEVRPSDSKGPLRHRDEQ
ncbi:RNA polymerase sigma factor [Terriglobus albidus]|uniref:RNA polymerase sigma factor n=1 Tax=Terriglobus albidus TaxID=1592106 RepID=A0A5B9EBP2_9BACT|nr:RNA polymerase sigma factor [Terriglobus albidus]QEE28110.1 RNA polymerase sigma factor [Terriglobus albidus]